MNALCEGNSLQSNVNALERLLNQWVEYFRPITNMSPESYAVNYMDFIRNIAMNERSSINGMSAQKALNVHDRLMVAHQRLHQSIFM